MVDLWAENIATYNKGSLDSQARARSVLEKNGVKFTDPSAQELAATRTAMIAAIDPLIKEAKFSAEVVKLVKDSIA
jgi:hypothetical protein